MQTALKASQLVNSIGSVAATRRQAVPAAVCQTGACSCPSCRRVVVCNASLTPARPTSSVRRAEAVRTQATAVAEASAKVKNEADLNER
jgi:hypothetical protein